MIIELERYNEIGDLLIENRTTGVQGHICYQDGDQRVSVTRAAVCMGVKEARMKTGHRVHTINIRVKNESRYSHNHCRAIKEALACNKMKIDTKVRGLEP